VRRPEAKGRRRPPIRVTPAAESAAPAAARGGDRAVRLNRLLATAGVCSRRAADGLIEQGRVTVNGKVVRELGARVDPAADDVRLDGETLAPEKPVYLLLNKPKDVVCTNAATEVRKRVIDLLPEVRGRIYTVGRLDADSEGLILLTNDGAFAQAVAHPRYGVSKTYAVLVRGRVAPETVEKARGGVWLAEGRTGRAGVRIERASRDRTYLHVTLRAGKNREIRRVFARLGHNVISLKRIRIGRLNLHGLRPGAHRFLRPEEVCELMAMSATGEES
jgi:pseudouridine synthase